MSIYKKKNGRIWYAEIYVREQRRCICKSTGKEDRAEALEAERLLRAAYNRELGIDRIHALVDSLYGVETKEKDRGIPISLAYARYASQLEATGRALDRKTLDGRRRNIARFVEWRDANRPACLYMCEVTRSVAGEYAAGFNADTGLSDKSKREGISNLGAVWNALMAIDENIRENPWRFFLKSVRSQREIKAFTQDEERRILDASRGTEWHAASVISRWTGLRLEDVCALKWEDVDWTEGVVRVMPVKTKRHRIAVTIPLAPAMRAELEGRRRDTGLVLQQLGRHYPHVEKSPCGAFSAILKKAGVDTATHTFHSWRHTFVTRGGEAGVSRELLMRMAGHATEMMSRHYDHSERLDELRGAMDAMANRAQEEAR